MRYQLDKRAVLVAGCAAVFGAFSPVPLEAAEYRLLPVVVLSEEYNDNLFQEAHNRRTDYVTRVQPSLLFNTQGGGFSCDLTYGIDYKHYARDSRDDEFDHRAAFKGNLHFWDGFLKVDLSDSYSRVSTNVARDVVSESLVVNQTEQNLAVISPYLTWRLAPSTTLKTGYRYTDTRYWGPQGIDKIQHDGYAEVEREVKAGLLVSAGYNFAHISAEPTDLDRHDIYGGFRYLFSQGSFLNGKVGNSWQSFSNGVSTSDPFWDIGIGKDFGVVTATIGTKAQYTEDPLTLSTRNTSYYGTLNRVFQRGTASFTASYNEYEKDQLAIPETQRKVLLAASGRYEFRPDLNLSMTLSGDRLEQSATAATYPYHLYGNFALEYALSKHTVLGANYSWISYRHQLDSAANAAEVNRAIVEMRLSL